ncbi:WD40 repeat protein [Pyrenophora tritici-repentis]|nr:WD40 repeat protein [Pyrenophora tritici-repentis]
MAPSSLRQDMCNLSDPGVLRRDINKDVINSNLLSELQYACRYWVDHIERSGRSIEDGDATHRFLEKHLLHWLEAMSLINETGLCPSDGIVARFLYDASQFVLRFVPILAEAPLQIYSSALIFSPEASIVRKVFIEQMPQTASLLLGRDAEWNACRSVLEGHSDGVSAVVFSPDGQLVASASWDSTVRVWETATGQCRSVLEGHSDWVNAVVFSPDGQLVVSASEDRTVRVWETATGQCRSVLHQPFQFIASHSC